MGDSLSPEVLEAFAKQLALELSIDLEKDAGLFDRGVGSALGHVGEYAKGFLGNVRRAGTRLDPRTMGEGWRELGRGAKAMEGHSGTGAVGALEDFVNAAKSQGGKFKMPSQEELIARTGLSPKDIEKGDIFRRLTGKGGYSKAELKELANKTITPADRARVGLTGSAEDYARFGERLHAEQAKLPFVDRLKARMSQQGPHMYQHVNESQPLLQIAKGEGAAAGRSRTPAMFEELSRRGWTGKGKYTKYVPLGPKGMMAGLSASAIPSIVDAPQATPTGEGGTLERGLGELGSIGGMIAGTGVGFVPGMALWGLGHYGGSRAGRVLDRLRSGATLQQAVLAPSPEEAANQLRTIRQYYG